LTTSQIRSQIECSVPTDNILKLRSHSKFDDKQPSPNNVLIRFHDNSEVAIGQLFLGHPVCSRTNGTYDRIAVSVHMMICVDMQRDNR